MAMPIPNYEIFIRDSNFEIAGVVDHYTKLELHIVHNNVGTWFLEMANDGNRAVELLKHLFIGVKVGGYSGIIITRNGEIVFSGITWGFEQTGEYTSQEDQENITFYGLDDNALIASRIVNVPEFGSNPANFRSPFGQNYPVWEAPGKNIQRSASNILYSTVANNIGFQAPGYRQIRPLWVKNDEGIGPVPTTIRGRYQNLLEKCQSIANYLGSDAWRNQQGSHKRYRGLNFRTLQLKEPIEVYSDGPVINTPVDPSNPQPYPRQTKRIKFEVRNHIDRTNTVIFSKGMKTLGSYRYKFEAPQATQVTLGGQNNESTLANNGGNPDPITLPESNPRTRWFRSKLASQERYGKISQKFGRWEHFLDRRDIQYGEAVAGVDNGNAITNPYPLNQAKYDHPVNQQQVSENLAVDNYDAMTEEFKQAIDTFLYEKRQLLHIEVEGINIPPTEWPTNYDIGDLVTVIIPGEEDTFPPIVSRVKEIYVTLTKNEGEVVRPIIGTETQPNGRDLFTTIKNIGEKTNFLGQIK